MEDVAEFFKRSFRDVCKNKIEKNYQQKSLIDRMSNFNNMRRETRNTLIFQKRQIDDNMTPVNTPGPSDVQKVEQPNKQLEKLRKWKIEKEKKKREEKKKAKPLFKVCHVPEVIGLPNLEDVNKTIKGKSIKPKSKSQFAPPNHEFHAPKSIKPVDMNSVSNILAVKDLFHINSSKNSLEKDKITLRVPRMESLGRNTRAKSRNQQPEVNKNEIENNKSLRSRTDLNKKNFKSNDFCTQKAASSKIGSKDIKSKIKEATLNIKTESKCKNILNMKLKISPVKKDKKKIIKEQPVISSSASNFVDKNETDNISVVNNGKINIKLSNNKKIPNKSIDASDVKPSKTEDSDLTKSSKISRKPVVKSVGWNCMEAVGDQDVFIDVNVKTSKTATKKYKRTPRKEYKFNMSDEESNDECIHEKVGECSSLDKSKKPTKQLKKSSSNPELTLEHSEQKDSSIKSRLSTTGSASPDYPIDNNVIDSNSSFDTPKNNNIREDSPVYISPFVTVSRGKSSARKEYRIRHSVGELTQKFSPDILNSTSPKAAAKYFSKKLNNEINRIEEMCDIWTTYKKSNEIPEEANDMIDVAIGQSQLLISKKFEQFRCLIEQCRKCESIERPVTCEDLHGFWDMIYIQVTDLDKRFNNLNVLKANNWEEIMPEKKFVIKRGRGRPKKASASASLKNLIKAARDTNKSKSEGEINIYVPQTDEIKIFDGGYYSVKSPVAVLKESNVEKNSAKKSLRASLLTDQTVNRTSSTPGLTMMRVSQAFKYRQGGTPSKSILKNESTKSEKKITKAVLFKDNLDDVESNLICTTERLDNNKYLENMANKENNINEINLITFSPIVRRSERLSKIKL